jgi:hypothetical protein
MLDHELHRWNEVYTNVAARRRPLQRGLSFEPIVHGQGATSFTLGAKDHCVWLALLLSANDLSGDKAEVNVLNNQLAVHACVSDRELANSLQSLAAVGLVERKKRGRGQSTQTTLFANPPGMESAAGSAVTTRPVGPSDDPTFDLTPEEKQNFTGTPGEMEIVRVIKSCWPRQQCFHNPNFVNFLLSDVRACTTQAGGPERCIQVVHCAARNQAIWPFVQDARKLGSYIRSSFGKWLVQFGDQAPVESNSISTVHITYEMYRDCDTLEELPLTPEEKEIVGVFRRVDGEVLKWDRLKHRPHQAGTCGRCGDSGIPHCVLIHPKGYIVRIDQSDEPCECRDADVQLTDDEKSNFVGTEREMQLVTRVKGIWPRQKCFKNPRYIGIFLINNLRECVQIAGSLRNCWRIIDLATDDAPTWQMGNEAPSLGSFIVESFREWWEQYRDQIQPKKEEAAPPEKAAEEEVPVGGARW